MALPIPDLHDKDFEALVGEARQLIPRFYPEWTDHNLHDPGITFLELFAWLNDLGMFRLNQVGPKHVEIFAAYLKIRRALAQPATVEIWPNEQRNLNGDLLPAFTRLSPQDREDLLFETDSDLFLTNARIKRISTLAGGETTEHPVQPINPDDPGSSIVYPLFGHEPRVGDEVRVGFSPLFANEPILRMTFAIYTTDLMPAGQGHGISDEGGREPVPSVDLEWQFLSQNGWRTLKVRSDSTRQLSTRGHVTLDLPPTADWPARASGLAWLRVCIRRGRPIIPPLCAGVAVNVLTVRQVLNVRREQLGISSGRPDQAIELRKPMWTGDSSGWSVGAVLNWSAFVDELLLPARQSLRQKIRNAGGPDLEQPIPTLNTADGQRFRFRLADALTRAEIPFDSVPGHVVKPRPIVQVEDVSGEWQTWREVEDFEEAAPDDQVYAVAEQAEKASIVFGNGLNGRVPPEGRAIHVLSYFSTQGDEGTVAPGKTWLFRDDVYAGTYGRNLLPSTQGDDAETTMRLRQRVAHKFRTRVRAVTLKDYESLALQTPGLRIARVKALDSFHPRLPCESVPGAITIVAVAATREDYFTDRNKETPAFLRTIHRYLDGARLLTDELFVVKPDYVAVTVNAMLLGKSRVNLEAVRKRASKALSKLLSPLSVGDSEPWPFGRPVYPSDLQKVLDEVEGVEAVLDLSLSADGTHRRLDNGTIVLPRTGLVISGDHEVTLREAGADDGYERCPE